ncbi:hypothetical protein CBR_g52053 [Chara braunii]|uniref:Diacylglycerol kinase n=1 Tax=Chara braunii TaxID=69332 RepID=A0A388M9C1_CHABU|nr:hypothetical protein CBR_g52053 [Chara braunii]|eukprot:GBG91171.1 hypothetical protein CBR_g52053 [Chara braunii]
MASQRPGSYLRMQAGTLPLSKTGPRRRSYGARDVAISVVYVELLGAERGKGLNGEKDVILSGLSNARKATPVPVLENTMLGVKQVDNVEVGLLEASLLSFPVAPPVHSELTSEPAKEDIKVEVVTEPQKVSVMMEELGKASDAIEATSGAPEPAGPKDPEPPSWDDPDLDRMVRMPLRIGIAIHRAVHDIDRVAEHSSSPLSPDSGTGGEDGSDVCVGGGGDQGDGEGDDGEVPSAPVLIFINSRSGGGLGRRLQEQFVKMVGEAQVYDLGKGKLTPNKVLFRVFRCLDGMAGRGDKLALLVRDKLRVVVCGGDGTVGWILGAIAKLGRGQEPPLAVVPLGTGNDLSRTFGWGPTYSETSFLALKQLLLRVAEARPSFLDSWELRITCPAVRLFKPPDSMQEVAVLEADGEEGPRIQYGCRFWNYLSVGMDAQIAYGFHRLRESNRWLASGRLINQAIYGHYGCTQGWFCGNPNQGEAARLNCVMSLSVMKKDGSWELLQIPANIRGIAFLNLQSYAGGRNPWGSPPPEKMELRGFSPPYVDDGIFEIVGFRSGWHLMMVMGYLSHGKRLAQARAARIEFTFDHPGRVYMQADGEPWRLPVDPFDSTVVEITRKGSSMLLKTPDSNARTSLDAAAPTSESQENRFVRHEEAALAFGSCCTPSQQSLFGPSVGAGLPFASTDSESSDNTDEQVRQGRMQESAANGWGTRGRGESSGEIVNSGDLGGWDDDDGDAMEMGGWLEGLERTWLAMTSVACASNNQRHRSSSEFVVNEAEAGAGSVRSSPDVAAVSSPVEDDGETAVIGGDSINQRHRSCCGFVISETETGAESLRKHPEDAAASSPQKDGDEKAHIGGDRSAEASDCRYQSGLCAEADLRPEDLDQEPEGTPSRDKGTKQAGHSCKCHQQIELEDRGAVEGLLTRIAREERSFDLSSGGCAGVNNSSD